MRDLPPDLASEWLETDGLGGFASGTVGGYRTRRYHALLLTARRPPTDRVVLVNGFEVWVDMPEGRFALSTQYYPPDIYHPEGYQNLVSFSTEPWPVWRWRLPNGVTLEQELFLTSGRSATFLRWRLLNGNRPVHLEVRPLLSGRDYHALHHENPACRFEAQSIDQGVVWRTYDSLPSVTACFNGHYEPAGTWYRQFLYSCERQRGMDHLEDLASPGILHWELSPEQPAVCMLATEGHAADLLAPHESVTAAFDRKRSAELQRRERFASPLHRAADMYLVRRGTGQTIIAGYPWFTDWGRDTFISVRGLCLALGRLEEAGNLLVAWADTLSQGMLPNRFPDQGDEPEFNAVDASLWFVIAVHDYFQQSDARQAVVPRARRATLQQAVQEILQAFSRGTRYQIHRDTDGLLAAGVPGVQLTWMDAKVGDRVITPRMGKPVEVQALWLNALAIAAAWDRDWQLLFEQGVAAFRERFWNPAQRCLYDVVDVDHRPGTQDAAIRPNQIFAVGGLPRMLLASDQARQVVNMVEAQLLTPLGLRTLAPGSSGYFSIYAGPPEIRDAAYHQGTVWPWLLGAFVEAWVRVRGNTDTAREEARDRFLPPLLLHLQQAGLGHLSEITDAEAPFTPRGCPFQAWSLSEFLRLKEQVLRT